MELGYLTKEGFFVVADSLGGRFPFKAYRIDESGPFLDFLGWRQPLERIANVTIEVALHRNGWTRPGELLLRRSSARMYRSRIRHYVLGMNWRSLKRSRWNENPFILAPWFSSDWLSRSQVPQKPLSPSPNSPFVVAFHDGAVKGCRRSGSRVELLTVELKEFTDFVLGKLKVMLQFESESEAEEFARHYPDVPDPNVVEASVQVEISRSRQSKPFKRGTLVPMDKRIQKRALRWLLLGAILMNVQMAVIIAFHVDPVAVVALPVPFLAALAVPLRERLARRTEERQELIAKWPARVWDRWASHVPAYAASFLFLLKEMGVKLNPDVIDLEPLDALLRKLPSDTLFGAVVLGAGALAGQAFLANLGQKVQSEWLYDSKTGMYVLQIRDAFWVSPVSWVARIWDKKPADTLQGIIEHWTSKVRMALAFRHRIGFFALGFTADGDKLPEALMTRVTADANRIEPESFVLDDRHFRRRRVAYGRFSVDVVEVEYEDRQGPRFQPAVAIPFFEDAIEGPGRVDGTSPYSPAQEDVAVIRLEGQPMIPIGVELRNFVEVGRTLSSRQGDLMLRLNAVADRVDIATPRMRDQRPEVKDFLVPMDAREDGLPLSPYARFLGRIEVVRDVTNPILNVPLWLLRLSVSDLPLDVLVRKDRCSGLPTAGHFLSGNAWLVADITGGEPTPADYIR